MAVIDTRLIQTAVMGGRDSENPVILPEEAHNLDQFRLRYGDDDYWCSVLLGGCGEPLTTKRYEDKVCHFSHLPDPQGLRDCRRSTYGATSADHLFIKRHVKAWLAGQGHMAQANLRSHGHGPADAVDFRLRATELLLRFELRAQDYRSWIRAADSLGAASGHVEWVFGADSPLVAEMVARQGYALCCRCETSGADRRVFIGVVDRTGTVAWAPLEECGMTREGLTPPALDKLRADGLVRPGGVGNPPLPASLPLRGAEIVFAVDPTVTPPPESPVDAADRYLVAAHVKPAGSRIVRAHISLPLDTPPPTEEYVYRLSGTARVLVTDTIGSEAPHWAIRADGLTRLKGLDAERTGLWLPSVAVDRQAPATNGTAQAAPAARPLSPRATRLRDALRTMAARRTTTTWQELARPARLDLAHLSDHGRRDLLVEVDAPGASGAPLLSVLIRTRSGNTLPYLSTVLRMVGVDSPASDAALQQWCAAETERTYAAVDASNPTPVPQPEPVPGTVSFQPSPESILRLRRLRELVREARKLVPRATGRRAHRLAEGIRQAEQEAADFERATAKQQGFLVSARVIDELDRVIGHPTTEPPAPAATVPWQADPTPQSQQPTAGQGHESVRPTKPISVSAPKTHQQPKANHAELRTILEDLTAAGADVDTARLRTDIARAKLLKAAHHGTLPRDLLTMFAVCSQRLAQRIQATITAASPTPVTPDSAEQHRLLPESELDAVAAALHAALKDIARRQSTTTWPDLGRLVGAALTDLQPDEQSRALIRADQHTPDDEPLLSALITHDGHDIHPLYPRVARALGRELPCPSNGLQSQWQMDVLRLHTLWRHR
ncbi:MULTISPECIES: hypothetical protein [unclassified Streptomyces]|uniref:hypothetical protein n=1 Tax=unclassified Streptomyces TaxID=2593676 RepID=UPI0013BB81AA|nr:MULTISPECIES: hypothetical protein [unclassified Streptomyces]NDZ92021.1 hypothetical protein [Streptomyces sp. SID10115]NEA03660.1 hypothetical protein [Streptomyces sp. SID10116]NEB50337.1 hypothetical protein [Streptomyces sp. SID339]